MEGFCCFNTGGGIQMDKKVVFSGVQPSGGLTIGNYIGAIKNFVDLQEKYNCYYCIVDLHAITVPQKAKDLRKNTIEVLAIYLASGLDPEKSTLFIQSHLAAHAELTWVLNTISYMGQLNRMTQFKEKSERMEENLNAGLYTYPVLMAADILLYHTEFVPVGEDQKQHLELARDLAERFNNRYSETFKVPKPLIQKFGSRIMSLQNPESKMSKSDENENSYILILDKPDVIRRKIKRAVTDSVGQVKYNDEQLGVKNLMNIYSAFSGDSIDAIENRYEGLGYGNFKEDVARVVIDGLTPIQEKYDYLMKNKDYLEKVYTQGAEKANHVSMKTLRKVYKKVGFILKK